MKLQHKFVEYIPESIEEGVLYISLEYGTVLHKCACGCGNEVNTPLNPNEWNLTFNGESISIRPSIGNWSFKCQSHYWITENQIEWASQWSRKKIKFERKKEIQERDKYNHNKSSNGDIELDLGTNENIELPPKRKWYDAIIFWR